MTMANDKFIAIQMTSNDFKWFQMTLNDFKWLQLTSNHLKVHKVSKVEASLNLAHLSQSQIGQVNFEKMFQSSISDIMRDLSAPRPEDGWFLSFYATIFVSFAYKI